MKAKQTITWSKSRMEILEKGMKYVQSKEQQHQNKTTLELPQYSDDDRCNISCSDVLFLGYMTCNVTCLFHFIL